MAQLTDDCFAFGGALMPLDEARARLVAGVGCVVGSEQVHLGEALDRALADAVTGTRNVPPTDNSAVDGYAVRHADLNEDGPTDLPIGGVAAAGRPLGRQALPGEAVRIFTGAAMPTGMDTVLMQEDCVATDERVTIPAGIGVGANRRFAGEDVKVGDVLFDAGHRLRPQDIGVLASQGHESVAVLCRLKVALLSTGDEVTEPGRQAGDAAIYDSNRFMLGGLLRRMGCAVTDLGIVEDNRDRVRDRLHHAAAKHDLIVTSGSMSTGDHDHIPAILSEAGRLDFWRLSIKPGRPVGLGILNKGARNTPVLGLPGNPVAAMVTFLFLGRLLVERLSGMHVSEPHRHMVRLEFAARKKANRREYIRVSIAGADPDGTPRVARFPRDGAGILMSMVASDGLVELVEGVSRLDPGALAPFIPFSEVMP